MPSEDLKGPGHFIGMYRGVVVDNKDPRRVGRCRVRVSGVLPDEGGAWAPPIGGMGAGSAARGIYDVPPIGSDVAVWFEQGDCDHPYYLGGNPGTSEVPVEVADADDDEQATKVAVWETERWRVKLDGRFGQGEFHIIDKVTGSVLEIDGVRAGIRIKSLGKIQIESDSEVAIVSKGGISIGGRTLVKNGLPIQ